jgi:Fe2+ transport system protein B
VCGSELIAKPAANQASFQAVKATSKAVRNFADTVSTCPRSAFRSAVVASPDSPLAQAWFAVALIFVVVFSVMFFVFPAGLVLYWLTNNILSIAQQWIGSGSEKGPGRNRSSWRP